MGRLHFLVGRQGRRPDQLSPSPRKTESQLRLIFTESKAIIILEDNTTSLDFLPNMGGKQFALPRSLNTLAVSVSMKLSSNRLG